jgi:hypothetical protein
MFSFSDTVASILLEVDPAGTPGVVPPQTGTSDSQTILTSNGFNELRNAYAVQYGKTLDVNEILKTVNIITGGGYIAAKYTNVGYIPFIDAFAQIYAIIDNKDKSKFTQTDIIKFIIDNAAIVDPIFNKIAANLKNTTNVFEYEPGNPDVNRAWRSLMSETNKLSQTAIQSLGSDTIHFAVTKIIAKRIPILDRVAGLKGLVRPFNKSVITPIFHQFKKYTGYKQGDFKKNPKGWLKDRLWPKKISGDFSKMVEDISANNLLNVAVLSYEYYIYLLSTQGQPLYTQGQQRQNVNASLNIFDKFVNNLLQEDVPQSSWKPSAQRQQSSAQRQQQKTNTTNSQTPQSQNNAQQTSGLPSDQIEKISNQIGNNTDPDYESFLDNGESRYLPETKYILSAISKDPSREAQALYRALTDMAYFVRKSVGAKERMTYASQAASSLASFAGATLYGGPQ